MPTRVQHVAGALELHRGESPTSGQNLVRVPSGSPNLPLCEPNAAGHRADYPTGQPTRQAPWRRDWWKDLIRSDAQVPPLGKVPRDAVWLRPVGVRVGGAIGTLRLPALAVRLAL
jgi:hypothetical protein